jgi:LPS-assembly protein
VRWGSRFLRAVALSACVLGPGASWAQLGQLQGGAAGISRTEPVTFSADSVEYQQNQQLVIAKGNVEAWQNGRFLRADEVTFDRRTGIAIARGHVTLIEPGGQTLFADAAELSQNMRDGILTALRARLPQNARLAANGGRRTAGVLNSLSKVVYSTCNLCKKHPERPPLWQVRAANATEDTQHKKIEYTDAEMQIFGVPVAYFPYFWTAEPGTKRESGFLMPSFGTSSHIGAFTSLPYYWVIDNQSDLTITPMLTTEAGPDLDLDYRRRFNFGSLEANVSAGHYLGSFQGTIFTKGQFDLDDTWRAGFNVNRASSANYVNDFHLGSDVGGYASLLTSNIYLEGFGEGAYSRLDTTFYQGLTTSITNTALPVVLPRYQYDYFGEPDALGGRLSIDAMAFNVFRGVGTNTRRASLIAEWDRPFVGLLGDLWTVKLHNVAAAYDASDFNEQPNFGTVPNIDDARAYPQAALDFRWPFARYSGAWGTQIIEPMAELIAGPVEGSSQVDKYPIEDAFDFNLTDMNLFGFNRFGGIDRLEGGSRANVAMHTEWLIGGVIWDGFIGQSYRTIKDTWLPEQSGLQDNISDIVGHLSFTPTSWFDVTNRFRFDHRNWALRWDDATASVGNQRLRVTAGYLYSSIDPYYFYSQAPPLPPAGSPYYTPRNEITLSASTTWGRTDMGQYRFSGFAQRDLALNQMVALGGDAIYENECLIVDFRYYRLYTNLNGQGGSTTLLLQFTFKTIGEFGFHAL